MKVTRRGDGFKNAQLVRGFDPPKKNMLVKLDHFPKDRGEHKNV